MKKGNIYRDVPAGMPDEIFEAIAEDDHVTIERIVSFGQTTPEGTWYDQDRNEWVMVLRGSAEIVFEEDEGAVSLSPGDYVFIEAHRRHRVTRTDDKQPTVWLAVHFPWEKTV